MNISNCSEKLLVITFAYLTGFIGDGLLQIIVGNTKYNWGLKEYFRQHGVAESVFIAGGMLAFFYMIYFFILRLPLNPIYISIYAIVLDLLFRELNIFPSLKGYYSHLNYFWSAFWAVIPMLIPYYLYRCIK